MGEIALLRYGGIIYLVTVYLPIRHLLSANFGLNQKNFIKKILLPLPQEEEGFEENLFYNLYNSNIADKSAKIDFDFIPSPSHYLKFGIHATYHTFRPGAFTMDQKFALGINTDSLIAVKNTVHSQEYNIYVEDNFSITARFKGNFGLHTALLTTQGTQYWSLQPRLSLQYEVGKAFFFKTSIGKASQNLHLLTSTGIGLPTDLWVPATSKIKPQEAWQFTLGADKWLSEDIALSAATYYKKMNHLISYQEGSNFLVESPVLNTHNWEDKVTVGKGKSYGLELSLKKERGKLKGWVSYTYSKSRRQFESINAGKAYNFRL